MWTLTNRRRRPAPLPALPMITIEEIMADLTYPFSQR